MILKRIEVRNFRKFIAPMILESLPPGLAIIAGDNEDGKSTLVSALRAAFFYKHSWGGKVTDSLQPHGSNAAPEVKVEFELGQKHYRLRKSFCRKAEAELEVVGGTRWDGDSAEEELARLLGMPPPGRAPQSEAGLSEGPLGLLWIKQGGAWTAEVPESGRGGLQDALRAEVGDVLGGPRAKALMSAVQAARDALLTPARGEPTGEYKALGERRTKLAAERDALMAKVQGQEALGASLERNRARLRSYRQDLPRWAERRQEAQRQSREAQTQQAALERLRGEQRQASDRATIAEQKRQRLRDLRDLVTAQTAELKARQETEREARVAHQAADAALAATTLRERDCAGRLQQAERLHATLLARRERATLLRQRQQLGETIAAADAAEVRARSLRAEAAAITTDAACIQNLRKLESALASANAALEAAATRIAVQMSGDGALTVEGKPEPAPWNATLASRTQLHISSAGATVATITVSPAASATDPLARRDRCLAAWNTAAEAAGVASLAAAEQHFERRQRLLHDAELAQRDLAQSAPQGLEAMRLEAETLDCKLAASPGDGMDGNAGYLEEALASAATGVQAHTEDLRDAGTRAKVAQAQADSFRQALATAEQECKNASERLATRQSELDPIVNATAESDLDGLIAAAKASARDLEQRCLYLEAALALLDPARLAQQLEMTIKAHEQLEADIRACDDTILKEAVALAAAEPEREPLQAATREIEWLDRRHAELARRAAALKLLMQELERAQSKAEAHYLAPVTRRIVPLLQRLLPGSEIVLDESLQITGLRRADRSEPFHSLSHGTREQLAVLVRLAFADLLRSEGKASITILDDAPAYSDDRRMERMLEILQGAGRDGQILIFTCRERDFRPSGAAVVHLAGGEQSRAATL